MGRSAMACLCVMQVNKGRMFFWFFEAQKPKPEEQPLVIWMTGRSPITLHELLQSWTAQIEQD